MTNYRKTRIVAALLLMGMIVTLVGCLGEQATNNVLIPAMQVSWPGVRADAVAGGADEAVLVQFDTAIAAKDKAQIVALWPAIKISATGGIESDPPGLRASKGERIKNFDEAVGKIAGRIF